MPEPIFFTEPQHEAAPTFPSGATERDRWILARRPAEAMLARRALDPQQPYEFLLEEERAATGDIVPVATVFLTNRECPWRCLMCDLWRNTLTETVPPGAIPAQIDYALHRLPLAQPHSSARHIKLYNSGSFFDPKAIPPQDYEAIAARLHPFERIVVECHPALLGESCLRFRDLLHAQGDIQLEVAMGLETVHPKIGPKLNKRMTLDGFVRAAAFLREHDIALRVFILVKPPFMDEDEALHWAQRSLDFAFDCGATVAALIPTRAGNGALEELAAQGLFSPPRLATLEAAAAYGIGLNRGRVFADLWDLQKFSGCAHCFAARQARLNEMNMRQTVPAVVACPHCEGSA